MDLEIPEYLLLAAAIVLVIMFRHSWRRHRDSAGVNRDHE